jgi:hypothetical protein
MSSDTSEPDQLDSQTLAFYRRALLRLNESGIPFLVGGAYALAHYTGVVRHTKDVDVFVRPEDCPRVLEYFARHGYHTEFTFPHWLAKVFRQDNFVDVIFSSGNGTARVDDGWFAHAVAAEVFGVPVRLCPVEEMIWSKGFVLERERYDGADINHLVRACGDRLDWRRLLDRYGDDWRVLFSHLILLGYVYPAERTRVPAWVVQELTGRLQDELRGPPPDDPACRGTLISREQYLTDINRWGYADPRLAPRGNMTPEEIAHWTAAIGSIK